MKRIWTKHLSLVVFSCFLVFWMQMVSPAKDAAGRLRGFVYGDDGKKPLGDAMVLLRETTTQRLYQSEKTRRNGAYKIENILPGVYAVGIQWGDKEYNVDVLIKIEPKKQMACFTLPKPLDKPGYQVRCSSPTCFFVTPCGWALVAGATAGITYGIIKITEKAVSPTGI